jgi:hypothetical protein
VVNSWFRLSGLDEKEGENMYRNLLLLLCLLLALLGTAMAEDKGHVAKQLSGMSIVGNDEAPKALYIVPWKSSEIGVETGLNMMLTESAVPVDRDVFMRQLNFFEVSTAETRREH